jgi:hypothetical protein
MNLHAYPPPDLLPSSPLDLRQASTLYGGSLSPQKETKHQDSLKILRRLSEDFMKEQ